MDSSSSTRFRFRDHQQAGESSDSDTCSVISSVSSGRDDDSDPESMTGKGIKRLCSELVELKRATDEDFHRNIFSNYSAFVRIFEEVEGMENELTQLRNQVSTLRRLVKDLTSGIYLKVFSKEVISSIIEKTVYAESFAPSKLEVHTYKVLETLDTLLSEHRLDEALDVLEMEAITFQRLQLEENFQPDFLTFYNSAISERKALLGDHLVLVAENPRVSAPELQKALIGVCRIGDSPLATQLLLRYYHSRIVTGTHRLRCSKFLLHGVYIRDLSKFVFSMISQAGRSFVRLYGESSPHASELIQWACKEIEEFASYFNKCIKSISEISGGLSTAVEAVQSALSFCSLLETQKIVLRPCLIKHILPCMEEALWIHVNHLKKVIGIFTASDAWDLGRYIISGILDKGSSSLVVSPQLEYCLLTNSGRKFVTMLQAITEDISPLLALQMEALILRGLEELFMEYTALLEKAITSELDVIEKSGSQFNLADSPIQQVSILANASTLVSFYSSIVSSICTTTGLVNFELKNNQTLDIRSKEHDNYMLHIEKACNRLKTHFFQQMIYRIMSMKDGWKDALLSSVVDKTDPKRSHNLLPSAAFQVLFSELSKLMVFSEDNVVEVDWLMDLLRELVELILIWISDDKEFWITLENNISTQQFNGFYQFVLDMQFLVEVARHGEFLSMNIIDSSSGLVSRMELTFISAGLEPRRDINDTEWAKSAATEAIQKLLEIEKAGSSVNEEPIDNFEGESYEQSEYASNSSNDEFKTGLASITEVAGEETLDIDVNDDAPTILTHSDTELDDTSTKEIGEEAFQKEICIEENTDSKAR